MTHARPQRLIYAATAALFLAACLPAGAPDPRATKWTLVAIDGEPFLARGKIDLTTPGKIAGQGPCNRFFGSYVGTLTAFVPGAIAATKMACADLGAESAMFAALAAMTQAEVTGPATLLLTGPDGRRMEFVRPLD